MAAKGANSKKIIVKFSKQGSKIIFEIEICFFRKKKQMYAEIHHSNQWVA
jgi:hypothetical protein